MVFLMPSSGVDQAANRPNVEANWFGDWRTPLHRLSTAVFAPPLHWLSRLADHMARRPRCLVRAKSVSWPASVVVNTSPAMSFWPIIGVTPTMAHSWESVLAGYSDASWLRVLVAAPMASAPMWSL